VKIRGFRIEPGEVEAALGAHEAITQAVVVARDDGPMGKRLVAYVVPAPGAAADAEALRDHLAALLPEYMVPAAFVILDDLPRTTTGKVDRRALPAPTWGAPRRGDDDAAPRGPVEATLAAIWVEVLGIDRVGRHDDFFESGGDSLLLARLAARIGASFDRAIPLNALIQAPTIEQMARRLRLDIGLGRSGLEAHSADPKPPLFCAAFGSTLARHFGDYPVFQLEISDREMYGCRTFEELADCFVRALRRLQPRGPYALTGHSVMGLVVFEMARQLVSQGEDVRLLVLIDTRYPGGSGLPGHARIARFARRLSRLRPGAWPGYLLEQGLLKVRRATFELARRVSYAQPLFRITRPPVWLYADLLAKRYQPRAYSGPIALFSAAETKTAQSDSSDPLADWSAVATGPLERRIVPGTHFTMIKEPHVAILARELSTLLPRV
jgi:thioesterase domain-containing protein/acyl carrier protein